MDAGRRVGIGMAGVVGGVLGAASLWVLELVHRSIGPQEWTSHLVQLVVLVVAGSAIAAMVWLLGRPADVELLVDNIHVPTPNARAALSCDR